jgi:hypothetical protein
MQYISDIHLELRGQAIYESIIKPMARTLILAGDIGKLRPDSLTPFIDYCCAGWQNVLYVAGNHEFYDKTQCREDIVQGLRALEVGRPNFKFMDRDICSIDSQRYLGCTLWSQPDTKYGLNNFKWISYRESPGVRKPISTGTVCQWHREDLEWLKENVKADDIVITHFMPLMTRDLIELGHQSIYPPSDMDSYYGNSDCSELFARRPKLWISGHTHQSFSVETEEGVKWVCNPYGYPGAKEHIQGNIYE